MWLVAIPAYGRDYTTKGKLMEDWNANKDFQLQPSGAYINKEQLKKGDSIELRYAKLTKFTVLKGK